MKPLKRHRAIAIRRSIRADYLRTRRFLRWAKLASSTLLDAVQDGYSLVGPEGSVQAVESECWEPHTKEVSRVHVAEVLDALPDRWAQLLPPGTLIVGRLAISGRIHFMRARVADSRSLSVELLEEVHQAVAQDDVNEASAGELEPFVQSACDRSERTEKRRLGLLGSAEPCQS